MSTADIVSVLLNGTGSLCLNNNETHDAADLNITSEKDVTAVISKLPFSDLDDYLSKSNNSNITDWFEQTAIFSVKYQIFVAIVLFIFALGNILMALAPVFSQSLRKTRATVLLTFLCVLDLMSCTGAIAEKIYYSTHPFINYQWQMRCFLMRIPYHLFSFWGPVILWLIGLERITLLKYPFFHRFHVNKHNLVVVAFGCITILITILAISYGVLSAKPKRIPLCHNRFALQVQITDIGTFYYSSIYALVAVTYVIFGVLMHQHYRKINRNNRQRDELPTSHTTALHDTPIETVESPDNISIDCGDRSASRSARSHSLMKALLLVSCVYIFGWMTSLVVLLKTIGISIDNAEELQIVLYVSPILHLTHGCNFFVFSWAFRSYFDAYKSLISRFVSASLSCLKEAPNRGK